MFLVQRTSILNTHQKTLPYFKWRTPEGCNNAACMAYSFTIGCMNDISLFYYFTISGQILLSVSPACYTLSRKKIIEIIHGGTGSTLGHNFYMGTQNELELEIWWRGLLIHASELHLWHFEVYLYWEAICLQYMCGGTMYRTQPPRTRSANPHEGKWSSLGHQDKHQRGSCLHRSCFLPLR